MADKLVSVIVPMFNAEAHISAALSSIIQQDYKNLEIILVNDASSDSSSLIAKKILEGSGRPYRIIDHRKNRGAAAARNTGLDAAGGDYVWFCDSDDLVEKNLVSLMYSKAEEKNADAVFCGMKHYYESENRFRYEPVKFSSNTVSPDDYFEAWAKFKLPLWSQCNFLFSMELITKNGLRFIEGCSFGEDTEFLMKALANSSRVSFVKDMLYTYVHHPKQSSVNSRNSEMLTQLMLARFRTRKILAKRLRSRTVKNHLLSYYLPNAILKRYTEYARVQDRAKYSLLVKTLKHKKIRALMLSSAKFIFREPELFLKSATLIYAPNLYYKLRKGR